MKTISITLTCLMMVASACQVQVKTSYDHQVDFSQYKTYCWMTGCEFNFTGPSYLNDDALRAQLKVAIMDELKKKGLTEDTDNPDLLIGFTIAVEDEQAVVYHRAEDSPVYFQPLLVENREVVNYLKGTLIMGMADKKKSQIVWESVAIRYMELNPDFSEKNIRKGIQAVLKGYPPKK